MLNGFTRVFQIPELKSKILLTLVLLAVCRIGSFIPVPGINGEIAVSFFRHATGGSQNLFQMVDIFSGGAFSQMTVIALGDPLHLCFHYHAAACGVDSKFTERNA
jgi:preprotein translocase subunit SecY